MCVYVYSYTETYIHIFWEMPRTTVQWQYIPEGKNHDIWNLFPMKMEKKKTDYSKSRVKQQNI